ncbi:putative nucleotide exchange factor sil1 [Diaporthe ampelina]|uniref:Putative nucleotide exchange factor sil1 n=1 Tax=Diaporthe ampelina TaxID=1214573 RepID=A0A0G2FBW8_9PEZI|nr:putative nucleotide exchange factor sil1 [Diaporthe ampelina]
MSSHETSSRLSAGPSIALLLFLIFAILTFGASASTNSEGSATNGAKSNLICHTDNPAECYPRVFEPTDEFQTVHEDQEIPPGLHVRLDVNSGKREAKINDPNEANPALEGLPVDSSVVVIDGQEDSDAGSKPQTPKGAPQYESVGKIKEPHGEKQSFRDSLTVLKTLALNDRPIGAALEILDDISHDIYYGLKIVEDTGAIKELLCMMSSQDVFLNGGQDDVVKQAGLAASILGSALQNNHKALEEVENAWDDISKTKCAGTDRDLSKAVFNMLTPDAPAGEAVTGAEASLLSLTKAKTAALRGLIKSPAIRDDFLANGGMAQILEVLSIERPELVPAKQKLANLVLDNFLDESMGATIGVWPRPGEVDHDWDYKLKTLAKLHKAEKDHWSAELWKRLQEQRKAEQAQAGPSRSEL